MTTTSIKNYSVAPYYDDFDETKNYHRVLYRPGYAVQARELTQMQTALQAQIDRHGQYAFKDGSRVVNGEVSINVDYDYIKVEDAFTYNGTAGSSADLASFEGTLITGTGNNTNQVTALVLKAVAAGGGDPDTLYIKYQKSGGALDSNNNVVQTVEKFAVGEAFSSNAGTPKFGMVGGGTDTDGAGTDSTITNAVGTGASVSINEGVYFVSGCFIYVPSSTLILDKYTNNPSYIIGLQVNETIVSSTTDASLVDNAQGVPNTSAPGANRYQISTTLIKEPIAIASRAVNSYITLMTVENGIVSVDKTDKTEDTGLTLRLAQRTHDESGDYVVKPFELEILEHLNTGTNFGKYLQADGGSADKIALGIEPSTAYVKGYRNHKVGTTYVDIDKPRDATATATANNTNTQINFGNYIKLVKTGTGAVSGIPDIINFTQIDLKNSSSSIVGKARARAMETFDNHIRLYLFDIVMITGQNFSAVSKVAQSTYSFSADLVPADVGIRYDAGNSSLVFPLPHNAIKTLAPGSPPARDTIYSVKQIIPSVSVGPSTLQISVSGGVFQDVNDIIIAPSSGAVITNGSSHISSGANGDQTLTFNTTGSGLNIAENVVCNVIVTVQKTAAQKSKTNTTVTKNITVSSGTAASYNLDKSDIIEIVSITDALGNVVTDRFILDNGQRDNFYDEGKIIKISSTAPVAVGTMVVVFKHYEHGSGDYFCVDSYTPDYDTIPSFTGSSGTVELRDCIDFRPTKATSGSITAGSEFSTGTGFSLSQPPKVGHSLLSDMSYYLPRIDKLVMKRNGEFEIIKGVPSEYPTSPSDKEDSLTLYQLRLRPYVFTLSDIVPKIKDNQRYTMEDIGRLDKRIKNLEYYTSLSLLEQSAADIHMVDGQGNPRLKNGILVDSFRNHAVADMSHPEASESIDKENGILRPEFDMRNVNLITKPGQTQATGDIAQKKSSNWIMPYAEETFISQPYASVAINVNPYNVFTWAGRVQLSPESDEWKEVDVRPDVIIDDDDQYEQFVARAEEDGILGTVWNEWETNWSGRQIESDTSREWARRGRRNRRRDTTTITTTVTSEQSRSGLRTDVAFDTITRETGNRVVEVNFIPFMRSRKIYFKASRMKPNTKVYAFFNDVNVTAYCKSEAYQEWSDTTTVTEFSGVTSHPDSGSGTLTTNSKGQVTGTFVIPRNSTTKFKSGTKEFRISDSTTNNKTNETTSAETMFHAQGLIESTERTITNTKVPRLETTRLNDNRVISETFERTTTRWIDPLAQSILIEKSGGVFLTSIDLYFKSKYTIKTGDDAEIGVNVSIVSTENGIPTQNTIPGSEVELFPGSVNVSATAATATTFTFDFPVYLLQDQEYAIVIQSDCDEYECWVAEMGGFDVTNNNYRINKQPHGGSFFTSQNASTWTPDQSKDLKFDIKRAKFDTDERKVTFVNDIIPPKKLKPDSLASTSGSGVITVTHKNHGMHTTSSVIIAGAANFNGITASNINGTHTISNIKHDSYTITASNSDVASAGAAGAGSGGGSNITATENRQYDLAKIIAAEMIVPGTDIRYYLTETHQKSISGSESNAYSPVSQREVGVNENFVSSNPRVISSAPNEQSGVKAFTLEARLTNSNDHLSPVLDANRLSVITVQNRINDSAVELQNIGGAVAETNAYGGTELCKYITKKIDLADEASVIDVYLSANRPSDTNIDFYHKTLPAGSDVDFNSIAWTAMTSPPVINTNDNGVYSEVKYSFAPSDDFISMAFKIVLRSRNSSSVPTIKDFRAIAAT
jgi:hypothetical protein